MSGVAARIRRETATGLHSSSAINVPFDSVAQLSTKSAEPLSGDLFSPVRLFEPVEVRTLLSEYKPGAFVACFELDGRGRQGGRTSVLGQHGRVDDPFVGDDVAVEGVEDNLRANVVGVIDLSPAHAEIKLVSRIAASEPPAARIGATQSIVEALQSEAA
jgi:hypothetical protein